MKRIFFIISILVQNLSGLSQPSNINFELTSPGAYSASNSVSGWTLSSQTATCGTAAWTTGSSEFSIVSTPILSFQTIGNIGNSPLGGTKVARLNNSTANSSRTKLAYTFSVNTISPLLEYAFAGVWESADSHSCCAQSGFQIVLKNQSGGILPCSDNSFAPGTGCSSTNSTFSTSSTAAWSNWQVRYFDLTPWIGSLVTVEVIATDCSFGDHFGTLFFDARHVVPDVYCFCPSPPQCNPVSYCSGSNIAQLSMPVGYLSYQWISPVSGTVAAPQGTMSTLTVTNPVANSVYSVVLQTASGCSFISTLAIVPSTVSILASASNSSCAGGASGSATIATCGSGGGYNVAWYNSTNSLVGTSHTVSNLSPGTYSVVVTTGSEGVSCGIASSIITIGTNTNNFTQTVKPFCNNSAIALSYPGGTNYQWYNNLSAISASLGGTASSYTVSSPTNGSNYYLKYTTSQSCQDSIKITLVSVSSGSLNLASNPMICPGATNGSVTLNMSPSPGAQPGNNWYTMISTGTTSAYSVSISPGASNTFTAGGLVAGGTYSVNASDGLCEYNKSFTVSPYLFDYTLTPGGTPTVCSGSGIPASVNFSVAPSNSQYTYSWTPAAFVFGANSKNAIIVPTVNPGGSATMNYTVIVTPSVINCPLSKTMAITVANPITPSISPVPALCPNSSNYSIQVQPAGGTFINGSSAAIDVNTGVLTPSLAATGLNTFTYANSIGTCVAQTTSTFYINSTPQISISGDTTICEGQSTTLTASGATSYSWSNLVTNPVISVSPATTSVYLVTGTDVNSNCSSTGSVTVLVFPNPTLTVSGNTTVCEGQTTILTASGAGTYSWSNLVTNASISVSPITTSMYVVTGTDVNSNCSSTGSVTVSVFPNPTLNVSGDTIICKGETAILNISGADTYSWNTGDITSSLSVSPNSTTQYTVAGTNLQGYCTSTLQVQVKVAACLGTENISGGFSTVQIFPNPNPGIFYLANKNSIAISITDVYGRVIFESNFEAGVHTIDLRPNNSDLYLVKIFDGSDTKIFKILKSD